MYAFDVIFYDQLLICWTRLFPSDLKFRGYYHGNGNPRTHIGDLSEPQPMERHFASEIVFCLLYWIDRIGLETSAGNAKKEEKQVNMKYKTADPDPVARYSVCPRLNGKLSEMSPIPFNSSCVNHWGSPGDGMPSRSMIQSWSPRASRFIGAG